LNSRLNGQEPWTNILTTARLSPRFRVLSSHTSNTTRFGAGWPRLAGNPRSEHSSEDPQHSATFTARPP
jgi:hypothetical protein